jgi:LysM repeat protein
VDGRDEPASPRDEGPGRAAGRNAARQALARRAAARRAAALGTANGGSRNVTPAIAVALLIFVASLATSVTWVVAEGGLALPSRGPGFSNDQASPGAAAASPGPSTRPSPAATPAPTTVAVAPSVSPTAASRTPAPSATSDRYAVLEACPDRADCYRYTVRRGDNLWSIARWFGVPLDTVYDLNPRLRTTALTPGTEITLPTPTR